MQRRDKSGSQLNCGGVEERKYMGLKRFKIRMEKLCAIYRPLSHPLHHLIVIRGKERISVRIHRQIRFKLLSSGMLAHICGSGSLWARKKAANLECFFHVIYHPLDSRSK